MSTHVEHERGLPWLAMLLGAVVGALAFYIGGAFLLVALAADESDGWAGLAAVVAAMVTFAPLGAIVGALLAARRRVVAWWQGRPAGERFITVAVALVAAVTPTFFVDTTWEAVALATWGLAGGAVVGHVVGRIVA